MCGILASFNYKKNIDNDNSFDMALFDLKHRGPNDSGYQKIIDNDSTIYIGHTRLSIIDLTSAGHQPMHTNDGNLTIVFNGEIYNYKELKNELIKCGHSFNSDSDTEVLLNAWQEWGSACLSRLVGMFAFIIYNKVDSSLTIARDAFGIKPLYFLVVDKDIYIASEVTALFTMSNIKPALNIQVAYDFIFDSKYGHNDKSFFKDVSQLLPGNLIAIDCKSGNLDIKKWNNFREVEKSNDSLQQASEKISSMMIESVGMHLRSDVPLGVALSGGVDSSYISSIVRYLEPEMPIHAFSYIADGSPLSEEKYVNKVVEEKNFISHKVLRSNCNLFHDLKLLVKAQGEPFATTSIYAGYCLYKEVSKQGIVVMLDGQGADEIFGGYQGYIGHVLRSYFDSDKYIKGLSFLVNWSQWPGRSLSKGIQDYMKYNSGEIIFKYGKSIFTNKNKNVNCLNVDYLNNNNINTKFESIYELDNLFYGRRLADISIQHLEKSLPNLLRYGDRNSMAFSIESRVPFLTLELARYALSLPDHYHVSIQGQTKAILKMSAKNIVPECILQRKDKIGFASDEYNLIKSNYNDFLDLIRDTHDIEILHCKNAENIFINHMKSPDSYDGIVWRLINFIIWHREFIR